MEDLEFNRDDSNVFEFGGDDDGGEDEIRVKKKIPIKRAGEMKKRPLQVRAPPRPSPNGSQAPHVPQTPRGPPPQHMFDRTFESFSNPAKRMPEPDFDSDDNNGGGDASEASGSDNGGFEPAGYDNNAYAEEEPSPGFATVDDEKQDLLYKFHRLESRGVKVAKRFNAYSDVREMRSEYQKIKKDSEVNASVKFSRRILMAAVSATEFLNKRYDPFGIELNGWSETVMGNMDDGDYDNIFERLHEKYAGKVSTPPELELLVSLAGSAAMFHMTSTMFKSVPNIQDIAKQNPELKDAMKNMAEQLMKSQSGISQQDAPQPPPEPTHDAAGRREMRGPSIDLGRFGNFMPPPQMQSSRPDPVPFQRPDAAAEPSASESSRSTQQSGLSIKRVSVSEGGAKRGRKPKNAATKENTIDI